MKRIPIYAVIAAMLISLVAPTGSVGADFIPDIIVSHENAESEAPLAQEPILPVDQESVIEPSAESNIITAATQPSDSMEPAGMVTEDDPAPLPPIQTTPTEPLVIEPETTPPIIITSLQVSSTIEVAEIYNQSDKPVDVSSLRLYANSSCMLSISASGWLLPKEFLAVSSPSLDSPLGTMFSSDCTLANDISRVELYAGVTRIQLIEGISHQLAWLRHKSTVTAACVERVIPATLRQSGSASNDYIYCAVMPLVGGARALRTSTLYQPPAETSLRIIEVMSDSRSCTPTDASNDCYDFIKLKNTGIEPVNLAELRLRVGASTANSSATNTFHWEQPTLHPLRDEYMLEPGSLLTVRYRDSGDFISVTNGEGNVWIEDYYGIIVYDSVSYSGMSLAAAKLKSWIFDDANGEWTYGVPSPDRDNIVFIPLEGGKGSGASSGLKPCRDDQYRSEETNRCRNIVQSSSLTPCREGQYRSEETNRCRSLLAAVNSLKPCADDQFRNPATNRCKKIASADDMTLADCGEGRERNPATNRCRNVVSSVPSATDFAVEPVADSPVGSLGWWLFGGIAMAALGFIGWEYREEIMKGVRKVGSFLRSSK